MGGSSGGGGGGKRRTSSGSGAGRPKGMGTGSGGGAGGLECPLKIQAAVTGPEQGIAAGNWLEVQLDGSTAPLRIIVIDPVTGATVGSISGIPGLAILIQCLAAGVAYRAYVDKVHGGRVDVTLVQQ